MHEGLIEIIKASEIREMEPEIAAPTLHNLWGHRQDSE